MSILVTTVLVVVTVILLIDPWTNKNYDSPRDVAEDYFAAQIAGDAERMCSLLTPEERAERPRCEGGPDAEWVRSVRGLSYKIIDIVEHGDSADIEVRRVDTAPELGSQGSTMTGTITMLRIDDRWLIDREEYSPLDFSSSST